MEVALLVDNPEISIIVPVYKGVRFLREALESVRAQTFPDWECICVDDGSKDGSGALLDEIAATDARIRAFHRANGGTSVARNFALREARGRYIAFLDEDDAYHPRMLETLHAAAERTGADVVGCEFGKFNETGHPVWTGDAPDCKRWRIARDAATLADWVADYYDGVPFEVWRNLYRREKIAGHEFPPGVRVEQDLFWHYMLLPRIGSYVRIPWIGYAWRASSAGGFLNPDPDSLVSLTQTDLAILKTVPDGVALSPQQRRRLLGKMSKFLKWCVWLPLHDGLEMPSESGRRLRDGLVALRRHGVDAARTLSWRKAVLWKMFLLTGNPRWIRSSHHKRGRNGNEC